jgi:porin
VRDAETVIELTYQLALAPWWSVQPDVQYILGPTPQASRRPIQDAVVLGMRTSVRF